MTTNVTIRVSGQATNQVAARRSSNPNQIALHNPGDEFSVNLMPGDRLTLEEGPAVLDDPGVPGDGSSASMSSGRTARPVGGKPPMTECPAPEADPTA